MNSNPYCALVCGWGSYQLQQARDKGFKRIYLVNEFEAIRCQGRAPGHPGAILSDVFERLGLTNTEIARRLGISRQQLLGFLAERMPLSANIAVRIGKFLGQNGGIWLRMQAAYDLWHAEHSSDLTQVVIWSASAVAAKGKTEKSDRAA